MTRPPPPDVDDALIEPPPSVEKRNISQHGPHVNTLLQSSTLFFRKHQSYGTRMTRIASPARLMVAISDELRQKLEAAATKGRRSLSAEMMLRLEKSFEVEDDMETLEDYVSELSQRIDKIESRLADHAEALGLRHDFR